MCPAQEIETKRRAMSSPTTNAALFARAGRALFGDNWQQPTALLLGWPVDARGQNRTVQRIKAAAEAGEEYRIAPGALRDLAAALTERAGECARVAREIGERV